MSEERTGKCLSVVICDTDVLCFVTGVRVTRSLVLYICFVDRCLSFCTFLLAIVLSVLLQYTDSDYPFGIFKFFLLKQWTDVLCFVTAHFVIFNTWYWKSIVLYLFYLFISSYFMFDIVYLPHVTDMCFRVHLGF
jgi:hypothetical protein